MYNEFLIQ